MNSLTASSPDGNVLLRQDFSVEGLSEIPGTVYLTFEQIQKLNGDWLTVGRQFWTRVLALAFIKQGDVVVDLAGGAQVTATFQDAFSGRFFGGFNSLIGASQRIVNGGKTDCQIEIEREAAALVRVLLRPGFL